MIELLIGLATGSALTLAATKLSLGNSALAKKVKELEMAVSPAFQDLATQIEALPAKVQAGVQAQLDAANATVAQLTQDATDAQAAIADAVSKATPPA